MGISVRRRTALLLGMLMIAGGVVAGHVQAAGEGPPRYLLFVKPYVISGVDTGQFLITGDQGAYELTEGRYQLSGAPGAKIPATLPVTGFPAGALAP
jgi:hypothetical protein